MRTLRIQMSIIIFLGLIFSTNICSGQIKIVKNQYIFELKSDRGYQSNFAYIDEDRQEYLRTTSAKHQNYLEIYSLSSGKLKKELHIEPENMIGNFIRLSNGKFWIFNPYTRKLNLYDEEGKLLKRTDELESAMLNPKWPYTSYYAEFSFSPLIHYNGKLYFTACLLSIPEIETDLSTLQSIGMIRMYDIERDSFSWLGKLPQSLMKNDYGYLNRFSLLIKDDYLVVAPFYSNELLIHNLSMGYSFYPLIKDTSYRYISRPFAKLSAKAKSLKENNGGAYHYGQNTHYLGILYDKYKDIYYRILYKPLVGFRRKEISVMVLSSDFEFLYHFRLPSAYETTGMFVSEKGLNILNHAEYVADDSRLTYDTINFNK